MSSLYFGLDIFCQFEAGVPEFVTVFSVSVQYTVQGVGEGLCVAFLDSRLKLADTASAQYNDDISLLISQFLICEPNYVQYT